MARADEILPLEAPVGGLRKDAGYQQKAPYFTERCLNIRPFDVIEGRGRIGSRPGTVKAYSRKLGNPNEGGVSAGTETSFIATADTYLLENGTNKDAQLTLLVRPILSTYEGDRSVVILKFDVSGSIAAGNEVQSATLQLAVSSAGWPTVGNPLSMQTRRLTQVGWVENQATWDIYATGSSWDVGGGDVTPDGQITTSIAYDPSLATVLITGLKELVQAAVDDPINPGEVHLRLALNGNSADAFIEFLTSENVTASLRPTLTVVYDTGVSFDESEVRMLVQCRTLESQGITTFYEPFNADPMSATNWGHPSFSLPDFGGTSRASSGLPTVVSGLGFAGAYTSANELRTATIKTDSIPISVSTTAFRETSIFPLGMPLATSAWLFMDMDDTTPALTGGIALRATIFSTNLGELILYRNNIIVASFYNPTDSPTLSTRIIRMSIDAAGTIRVYWTGWEGHAIPDIVFSQPGYVAVGGRAGFGLQNNSSNQGILLREFSYAYTPVSTDMPPTMLVASANGFLYRETIDGRMSPVANATPTLRNDRLISAVNRLQDLYIADYELRLEGTAGFTNSSPGTTFDEALVNFSTAGVDADDDVIEILSGTGATAGVYGIAAVAAGSITLDSTPGISATNIVYRILRGPKVYDSATDTLSMISLGTPGVSQFPVGCRHFSLWADRIVAVNDPLRPHQWFMSAQGYPNLWDYGDSGTVNEDGVASGTIIPALGVAAAVSDDVAEIEGVLGDPIICTIPISNDYLIFACQNSFHLLRGNPRLNGAFDAISRTIGILDIGAWARTPENNVFVMTTDGLYEVLLDRVVAISRDVIPQELIGLDPERYEVTMGYDFVSRGIVISAVPRIFDSDASLPSIAYFYDQRTGGFFPDLYTLAHDAMCMVSHHADASGLPALVRGGRDGYLRRYSPGTANDDGVNFDSNCLYGPIRLGDGEYGDGYLQQIIDVLDTQSGPITLRVQVGHSAQVALRNSSRFETTMYAGRNRNRWPRLRGGACYIDTVGTPGTRWARESLTISRQKAGRLLT